MTSSQTMTDEPATDTDDTIPAHIRDTITAVLDAAGDLTTTETAPGALTVQVCSASDESYDPATWTTLGVYRAADAAQLADRLVDALGESANLDTDIGVLVVTHTYTAHQEQSPMSTIIDPTPPLLTLHLDRLEELDLHKPMVDPAVTDTLLCLQQHWLLQTALNSAVITYDRQTWGDLALSATFDEPNRHQITFQITYDIDGAPNVVDGDTTEYPADFNELDDDAQNAVPSTLVPNPDTEAGWLTYLVDALNDLHRGTDMLVRGWPQ